MKKGMALTPQEKGRIKRSIKEAEAQYKQFGAKHDISKSLFVLPKINQNDHNESMSLSKAHSNNDKLL